jgi:hypothetical protein
MYTRRNFCLAALIFVQQLFVLEVIADIASVGDGNTKKLNPSCPGLLNLRICANLGRE